MSGMLSLSLGINATKSSTGIRYDISTITYSTGFNLTGLTSLFGGLHFKEDGSKAFIAGGNSQVYEVTFEPAWASNSLSYTAVNKSAGGTGVRGVYVRPDGFKMYTVCSGGDEVNQFDLDFEWQLNSATLDANNFVTTAQDGTPRAIDFNSTGNLMFLAADDNDSVYQYSLTTPWDVSTAEYTNKSLQLPNTSSRTDLSFTPDGKYLYVLTANILREYELTSNWDISTAISTGVSGTFPFAIGTVYGFYIKPDGSRIYTVGYVNTSVTHFLAEHVITPY